MTHATRTREILAVCEARDQVWFLELSAEAGDASRAVGSVYTRPRAGSGGDVPAQVLASNDSPSVLWASPTGSVWVGSSSGHVATTAEVTWEATTRARYISKDDEAPWTATSLPPVRATGLPANVTALWGSSDHQVFAGTYGGDIFQWDGRAFTQAYEGPGRGQASIRAFGGGADDVFAAAADGVLLHFDGAGWRRVPVPDGPHGVEHLTGVAALPDGSVVISASGSQGRLLRGTAGGLVELTRTPIPLIDLVAIGDRLLMATGDGVAEWQAGAVGMIKSNFLTATAWPGRGRVFFIEPAQQVPAYIEFDPGNAARPWFRHKH